MRAEAGPGEQRLSYLDGWRGMAILLVVAGHFTPYHWLGSIGVELFFVLSGRLMAELLILRRQPLPDFVARRVARILPALIVYIALMAIVLTVLAQSNGRTDWQLSALGMLGFFHNYLPISDTMVLFQHGWSLAVEEHAYVLLALLTLVSGRRRGLAAALALGAAVLAMINGMMIATVPTVDAQPYFWRSDVRVASMLLPFAMFLLLHGRVRGPTWALASPACLVAGLWVLNDLSLGPVIHYTLGTTLLALATATLDVAHPAFRRLLGARLLVWPGLMSFSLYLWNQPFFCVKLAGGMPALCLAMTLLCALWSYHRVEKPARALLNARWAGRPVPA